MEIAVAGPRPLADQNGRIAEVIKDLRPRLAKFVGQRVAPGDVEDVLQDVFSELVEAYRVLTPIEEIGAWLFRVARNRIIDRFRKQTPEQFPETPESEEGARWEDTLPTPDAGPDALYARRVLLDEIALALAELPEEQRDAFIAHEIDGRSFKEIAAETGVSINTALSRKHYAVAFLRRRLKDIHDDFLTIWGVDDDDEIALGLAGSAFPSDRRDRHHGVQFPGYEFVELACADLVSFAYDLALAGVRSARP